MTETGLPTDLSTIASATVEAPWAKAGRQTLLRPEATQGKRQMPDTSRRPALRSPDLSESRDEAGPRSPHR